MFELSNEPELSNGLSDREVARRKKISESRKGQKPTQATKDKLSKSRMGKKNTPVARAKISKALKGKKLPIEHKEKISDCLMNLGHEHPAAVDWFFRAPCGTLVQGTNLCQLIRDNTHLFAPKDTEWVRGKSGPTCNAYSNLARVKYGARKSWKGWRLNSTLAASQSPAV